MASCKEASDKGHVKPFDLTLRFCPARSSYYELGQALIGAALSNRLDACGVAKLRRIKRN